MIFFIAFIGVSGEPQVYLPKITHLMAYFSPVQLDKAKLEFFNLLEQIIDFPNV